jgi:hypothetical protein
MTVLADRLTVPNDQSIVVFLIGMRINKWWMIHRWLPVALAMPRMLKELQAKPESGFLGGTFLPGMTIQYWESTEKLVAYAHDRKGEHYPAWSRFQRKIGTDGTVGIWHETFAVPAAAYESVYVNMPRFGLGKIFEPVPARGRRATAERRLGKGTETLPGGPEDAVRSAAHVPSRASGLPASS